MNTDWNNVILLSADALRADHLSCYGYHRETSPEIDKLAGESLRFKNAYSASSHTREAVPALLTGEFPDVAIDKKYRLATDTVASVLSASGYQTAGFHSNPYVSRAYGFDSGFDTFDDDLHFGKNRFFALAQRALDKLRNRHYARAWDINERSLEWLDSLDHDKPFFLWNHYMDTHGPYEPPEEYQRMFRDAAVSDSDAGSLYKRAINDPGSITDVERQQLIDLYDAEIRLNDEYISKFIEGLEQRGLLEESLVIITSDHGDAFGEHGYYEHPRFLHRELTHVPLLVRTPSNSSDVVETPVSTLDVAATIFEKTDRKPHQHHQSLMSDIDQSRTVFMQARGEGNDKAIRRFGAVSSSGICLAELDTETTTISIQSDAGSQLESALRGYIEERSDKVKSPSSGEDEDVSEEIDRRLNALGYK
jgi:arylsulfatase